MGSLQHNNNNNRLTKSEINELKSVLKETYID